MRRTHIMHTRDNRRAQPWHNAQREERSDDRRPVLAWTERSDGAHVMSLNGEAVAEIHRHPELPGWCVKIFLRFVGDEGVGVAHRVDKDAARLFCEAFFANRPHILPRAA